MAMTKDDIMRMAREAGLVMYDYSDPSLERFANLVAAAERNRTWTQDHWAWYERSIAATEREACAKVAERVGQDKNHIGIAAAIRAREQG